MHDYYYLLFDIIIVVTVHVIVRVRLLLFVIQQSKHMINDC